MRQKVDLDQTCAALRARGWSPTLKTGFYQRIAACRFRSKALTLAIVATELLAGGWPMSLRGLLYQIISAGWLPSTDKQHYQTIGRIMTILREAQVVPFTWLVDEIRSTIKPSTGQD